MMRRHSSHLAPHDELNVMLANAIIEGRCRSLAAKRPVPLAEARGLLCFAPSQLGTLEEATC